MPHTRFSAFAEALRDIQATSGRLAKADRLGDVLRDASDDDLARIARYASGRLFPLADERTVGVGFALLTSAIAAATGEEKDSLRASLVTLGDPGDVAAEAVGERAASDLTMVDVERVVEALAEMRGSKARTAAIADLLARLGTDEARFAVRLLGGELRIGMLAGGVELALARTFEVELADVQKARMLTGDIGETAVLARSARLGDAELRPFHPVGFMLATAAEDAADIERQIEPPFRVEDKFDGIRAQAHIAAEAHETVPGVEGAVDLHGETVDADGKTVRVALFSRTLDGIAHSFPDLVGPLAALLAQTPGGLILDGEIVPLTPDGTIAPFQSLQPRLGRKNVTDEMRASNPVAFIVYDALALDGRALLDVPFSERQAALGALGLATADAPDPEARIFRSSVREIASADALDAAFDAARERGNEGLMIKRAESPYLPGRRGRDWLKLKKPLATLDVVVTSVEVGSGGRRYLLSDFTFAVRTSETDDALLTVGKAYSGLTDDELKTLTVWFKANTLQQFAHGKVRVVKPEVVVEVAFDRIQPSPRHKSGYAMRFPRIVRLRDDKPVSEIDTLDAVAALATG